VAAVVQAEQDARCEFDGRGSNAKACPALKVVEEGLQGLVQISSAASAGSTYPRPGRWPARVFSSSMPRPCSASSASPATADRSVSVMTWTA
jgi:hypothetical protein